MSTVVKEVEPAELVAALVARVPAGEVWADGAMLVEEFVAFTRRNRNDTYRLMAAGMPYSQTGRRRLIPKRLAVELLRLGQRGVLATGSPAGAFA